jgi:Tfp pilus tip-associated adhesin PilY1
MIFVVLDQHTELNNYAKATSSMTEVDMSLHSQIHNVVLNNRLMYLNYRDWLEHFLIPLIDLFISV